MSLHGTLATGTIAKNGTVSGAIDLKRHCDIVRIEIPTIDNATLTLSGCETSGGTYRTIHITDTVAGDNNALATAAGTGGIWWVAPIGGFQYIKITAGASQTTAAVTFNCYGVAL